MIKSFDDIEYSTPSKINSLYKYQLYNKDYLEDLIKNERIYLSSPCVFNDPWDCKINFNTDMLEDPAYLEVFFSNIKKAHQRRFPLISDDHREQLLEETITKKSPTDILEEISNSMSQDVANWCRIYCLCPESDSRLLWSHYAQSHTGLCYEFSTSNEIFSSCMKVQYSENYPISDFNDNNEVKQIIPIITKDKIWEYEQEYRLIAQEEEYKISKDLITTNNNYLTLPSGSLKSLTLGCAMAPETVQEVINLLKTINIKLPLYIMSFNANKYALDRNRIDY